MSQRSSMEIVARLYLAGRSIIPQGRSQHSSRYCEVFVCGHQVREQLIQKFGQALGIALSGY